MDDPVRTPLVKQAGPRSSRTWPRRRQRQGGGYGVQRLSSPAGAGSRLRCSDVFAGRTRTGLVVIVDARREVRDARVFDRRLAVLLAMAMFVLVVDTSFMNVSISAVVRDLDTTTSGVQGAIALEALVSAAFILIGSKIGDLQGRKRAYVLGLLGYGAGAIAMTLAQNLTAIIIVWAIIGGLGASLLLPAMQSLVHGNFEGEAQRRVYAMVGAAAAIAAAVGPLLGGVITTYLSWRVAFLLEALVIAIVLSGIGLVRDAPYTGPRDVDIVGSILSVAGMGGVVLGILVWQEGGEAVGALILSGSIALAALAFWLMRRKRAGRATLIDPTLFASKPFRLGVVSQLLQQIALGGVMIVLPIYLQMVLGYNALEAGLSIAPLSLSMFAVAVIAGKRAGRRPPAGIIRIGFLSLAVGLLLILPVVPRASSGWYLTVPLLIAGSGLGLLVSQLNNYTLAPISEERVSEAAGVNSAAGSFGLSFGLAFGGAIMLAALSGAFGAMANDSQILSADEQQQVATALEHDAQVLSDEQLQERLAGQPDATQQEIIRINDDARHIALQVALLIPIAAAALGFVNSLRMKRQPAPQATGQPGGTSVV
jgi:EmrB/QacA subfamily drug resistance transporter